MTDSMTGYKNQPQWLRRILAEARKNEEKDSV